MWNGFQSTVGLGRANTETKPGSAATGGSRRPQPPRPRRRSSAGGRPLEQPSLPLLHVIEHQCVVPRACATANGRSVRAWSPSSMVGYRTDRSDRVQIEVGESGLRVPRRRPGTRCTSPHRDGRRRPCSSVNPAVPGERPAVRGAPVPVEDRPLRPSPSVSTVPDAGPETRPAHTPASPVGCSRIVRRNR